MKTLSQVLFIAGLGVGILANAIETFFFGFYGNILALVLVGAGVAISLVRKQGSTK